MSYKKRQRISQHGGGFMDAVAKFSFSNRTNTCMAVHPTQPLVAVGNDDGTVTLWEINQLETKRMAQLTGLPTSVKCVEIHKTLPLVAAACSDRVLIWRIDQTDKEPLQVVNVESEEKVNEVSCFSFHPRETYIAVGVNKKIIMYGFRKFLVPKDSSFEESSDIVKLHYLPTVFRSEGNFPKSEKALFTSFSSDGRLFSFVTIKSDGRPVLKVINFKDLDDRYMSSEFNTYEIQKKCAVTCITPYRTRLAYSFGTFYPFSGPMHTHDFIIGCDDGSLMLIEAVTVTTGIGPAKNLTRIETVRESNEWNFGEAIECVAVHPSLPLFASGSRNAVQIWDVDESKRKPEPLVVQPQLTPVISVGFNETILTVYGSGNVDVYSCTSNDYRRFKEELKKELQSGSEIANYMSELALAGRQGECSICGDPMNESLTQPSLITEPSNAEEVYLTPCGHKFHKKCIEEWFKHMKTCPECRALATISQTTPVRILEKKKEFQRQKAEEGTRSVVENLVKRSKRYKKHKHLGRDAAAASSAPEIDVPVVEPRVPRVLPLEELRAARLTYFGKQQSSKTSANRDMGGGKRNKYARKKYSAKKSKIRKHYSRTHKKYSRF